MAGPDLRAPSGEGGRGDTQAGTFDSLDRHLRRLSRYLIAIVLLHFAVLLAHAAAHVALGVVPAPLDAAFIVVVIWVGPLAALPLLRHRPYRGTILLLPLMASSFAYGFASHFVVAGPDNVAPVLPEPWTVAFVATGAILGVLELAGGAVAFVSLRAARSPLALAAPRA
jgi:hypothetical protein